MTAGAGDRLDPTLRAIWARVLAKNEIEDDDDFFKLGGVSRDVLVATSLINAALDAKVAFATFLHYPVFRDFRDRLSVDTSIGLEPPGSTA